MFVQTLKTTLAVALTAPPFLLLLVGCSFEGSAPPRFFFDGDRSQTTAIFCDVERGRQCATPEDIAAGFDITRPDEALWGGRSNMFAIDYSDKARQKCDGAPQKVLFEGPYPEGNAVCLSPDRFGEGNDSNGILRYPDTFTACRAWCQEHSKNGSLGPWIDGDGNYYSCNDISFPSHRAWESPFADACLESGMLRPDFQDPRKLPNSHPIVWADKVNVQTEDLLNNSLRKTSATVGYDAGAASSTAIAPGGSAVFEFTATETSTERTAGFARGLPPDTDPTEIDIAYAVQLRGNGELAVTESLAPVYTGTYATGDRIRLALIQGVVRYFKNGVLLYVSQLPVGNTPLRVSVSLRDEKATITNAYVSF